MPILTDNVEVAPEIKSPAKSISQDPRPQAPQKQEKVTYQTLPFTDSLQFLLFHDDDLRTGRSGFSLHRWQAEVNQDICYGRTRVINIEDGTSEITAEKQPDSVNPYKFALCAANGSGKDAFVIAPLALFFICCNIKAKVIITSSSGNQLSTQTEHYIDTLARKVNAKCLELYGQEIIQIRKRHYTCTLSGSVIHMFATDEKEKAEGHHPIEPGAKMLIIVNEAKSVAPDIFEALRRCTGYSHWVDVSSPGEPLGDFHEHFENWPNKRRVSFLDCPHHAPSEIEEDRIKYGEHSPFFRSKWLGLFTFIGGQYVISHEKLEALRRNCKLGLVKSILQERPVRIGLDIALSSNGDESVISFWKGNKQIAQREWRIQNATLLAIAIEQEMLAQKIPKDHAFIFADDGGVGRAVIDILNNKGWRINRVLNQSAAKNKKNYKNRGAQLWYKFSRLVEEGVLIFKNPNDDKLFKQLAGRKYKMTEGGLDKLTLQSKKEQMSEGFPSPDRADAAVLAFTDADLSEFLEEKVRVDSKSDSTEVKQTQAELLAELRYNMRHAKHKLFGPNEVKRHSSYSINAIMKGRKHDRVY